MVPSALWGVEEAAREFGVSPGTIRRDINVLLFCGLPGLGMGDLIDVDFDALEGEGVIRLSNADYLARPLHLSPTEATAVIVALRALRCGSCGQRSRMARRMPATSSPASASACSRLMCSM